MGALATCTVNRFGGKTGAEDDSKRLGLELDEANRYENSFSGTIIHFENMYAYVVKDTVNTLHLVRLIELSDVVAIVPAP